MLVVWGRLYFPKRWCFEECQIFVILGNWLLQMGLFEISFVHMSHRTDVKKTRSYILTTYYHIVCYWDIWGYLVNEWRYDATFSIIGRLCTCNLSQLRHRLSLRHMAYICKEQVTPNSVPLRHLRYSLSRDLHTPSHPWPRLQPPLSCFTSYGNHRGASN